MERTPRSILNPAQSRLGSGAVNFLPPLAESVLHVWILDLKLDRESLALQEEWLSVEEWQRVRRYASHLPGLRFIVRRGLLRCVLGRYLNLGPEEIRFVYNPHGKPFLAPELSSDLQFSLSDSGDKAAIAVGLGGPVGTDIERVRTVRLDGEPASHGSLPRKEAYVKDRLVIEHGYEFFQAWTRREALAKAEGVGLQLLSGRSDLDGEEDNGPSESGAQPALPLRGFHLHSLTLPDGYVGAVAARPKTPKIVYCFA